MYGIRSRVHPQRLRRTLGAASCLRRPAAFVARELRDVPAVGRYRLRGSELLARVRHPLLDLWVLEEIFRFRVYEPPEAVDRALERLGRPPRIVDLGGHVGYFGLFILGRLGDCEIVSFEADPDNAGTLERCVQDNRLGSRWTVHQAAAGTASGQAELHSSFHLSRVGPQSGESLSRFQSRIGGTFSFLRETPLLSTRRHRVERVDVFPFLEQADLIKIDIEGSEWEILRDPRFRQLRASAIVLEYHPAYLPEADAEQTVVRAFSEGGYATSAPVRTADAGTLWAWRPDGYQPSRA